MTLKEEAAQCLRSQPGRAISLIELARMIVAAAPEKYSSKLERSTRLQTYEQLHDQVAREISAERAKLLTAYPDIKTEKRGGARVFEWRKDQR